MKALFFGIAALAAVALCAVALPVALAAPVIGVAALACLFVVLATPGNRALARAALAGLALFILAPMAAYAQATTGAAVAGFGWLAIFEALPAWLVAITTVVTAATAITALTPTTADDKIISAILRVLNILAGNFGANKNKDDG